MESDQQSTQESTTESTQRTVQEEIVATIRINPKNYTDAYINNPEGGADICIEGVKSRNLALEGDLVEVKLNHVSKWKINYNTIANHWAIWADNLQPVLDEIEANEQLVRLQKEQATALAKVNQSTQDDLLATQATDSPTDPDGQRSETINNEATNGKDISRRKKRDVSANINSVQSCEERKVQVVASKLPANLPPSIAKLKIQQIINLPLLSRCIQKTGYVTKVIKRNHSGIAGGFLKEYSREHALFSPTDSRIPRMLIDIAECPLDFATLSKRYKDILFVARISGWEESHGFATGSLIKIVGDSNSIESRMETLLMESGIYDHEFPDDVYEELDYLNHLPTDWFAENSKNRRDLTDECIFTIDPKTARDLDDAVSIKKISEQIYEVGVHIADVSYFVKELTAVDFHARARTTSVYLVDRVIPMLPRVLCEQMCSLNPGEPKLTFSVIWKMDKYGHVVDEWFGRTIIKSCVKLAYEQAQDMIDNPDDVNWIKESENMPKLHAFDWQTISKSVVLLNKIAKNMRAKRFEGGALRIEQVKLKFELDSEHRHPTGFAFEDRKEANFLIEEYMLMANMAVAKRIFKFCKEATFLRRHPASSAQLLKEVKDFCDAKNLPLDISSAGSIQKSLNEITDPTMAKVVGFLILRSMKNAEYICVGTLPANDFNFSHFALNVPFYTHFTSPIRRYADVIVHRQLCLALAYEQNSNEDIDSLSRMAEECTKRKQSSKVISETSQKLYFNLFVQKAGFCELLACVTRIYDHSFDVILVEYNMSGRVYIDNVKEHLLDFKFESFSGIRRLVLKWKSSTNKKTTKKTKKKDISASQTQSRSRKELETSRSSANDTEFIIRESVNDQQIVEVFDIIKVIVTVDANDIGKLKINLKTPYL